MLYSKLLKIIRKYARINLSGREWWSTWNCTKQRDLFIKSTASVQILSDLFIKNYVVSRYVYEIGLVLKAKRWYNFLLIITIQQVRMIKSIQILVSFDRFYNIKFHIVTQWEQNRLHIILILAYWLTWADFISTYSRMFYILYTSPKKWSKKIINSKGQPDKLRLQLSYAEIV